MTLPYVQFGFNVRCEYLHDVCFIFGVFYFPFVKFSLILIRHMMKYWLDIKVLEVSLVRVYNIQKTELCLFQNWFYLPQEDTERMQP